MRRRFFRHRSDCETFALREFWKIVKNFKLRENKIIREEVWCEVLGGATDGRFEFFSLHYVAEE